MSARRPGQRGFTLIELMVSLTIASIAVGFIFRIYATTSVAYRTQSQIAELQQALRTAKQALARDLRQAGYLASEIETAVNTGIAAASGGYLINPIRFVNSATGPDEVYLSFADPTCLAIVKNDGGVAGFVATASTVNTTSCFAVGDTAIATRTADGKNGSKRGQSCVLKITGLVTGTTPSLQHNVTGGSPYNVGTNTQCNNIKADWGYDSYTKFMKYSARGYRIKPSDPRGVLQMSPSGGLVANDWQDLAFGFVDMQFALLVHNIVADTYTWSSGNNLNTLTFSPTTAVPVELSISFVARTVAEIDGPGTTVMPVLSDPANLNANSIGDHPAVNVVAINNPASSSYDKTSPYFGNYSYRTITTIVDLRNLGNGGDQ